MNWKQSLVCCNACFLFSLHRNNSCIVFVVCYVMCDCRVMIDHGIISHMAGHLVFAVDKLDVTSEVSWLMTYLAARYVMSYSDSVCVLKLCN